MGYDVGIGHANGGHGLVLHAATQVGVAHPIFLLPKRITAKQRIVEGEDLGNGIEIGEIQRVERGSIHNEVFNQHRVGSAWEVDVGPEGRILRHRYGYEVVIYGVVRLPVILPEARIGSAVQPNQQAVAAICEALRHFHIHIHRVYLVVEALLGGPPIFGRIGVAERVDHVGSYR